LGFCISLRALARWPADLVGASLLGGLLSPLVDGSFARAQPVAVRMLDRLTLHTRVCDTIVCMQVDRFSVTMETDLGAAVRDAAERAGMSVRVGWPKLRQTGSATICSV
jgi:hypothetical protein